MFEIKTDQKDIQGSNAVYYIESKKDLEILEKLQLDKKIITKVESILKGTSSEMLQIFLGTKQYENIYIFVYSKQDEKTCIDFISSNATKLPKKLTIILQNDKKISEVLKSICLSNYSFDTYKTQKDTKDYYVVIDKKYLSVVEQEKALIENICFARDLGETPSNYLYPEAFAKLVKATKFKNIKVKILSPKQIEKKGLGLIYGVGKGSIHKPYIVIMEKIIDKKLPTIGLVGKGVTFDTGGIQVKPGDMMYEMKGDMGGAACVFATMKQLDDKNLNINIVAAIGLAENHISGESYKPSDILTAYNKKTVDIVHTDAEGRLVMADVMSYISDKYNLENMITVATLTGACMVALGHRYAGIMGNDDTMIDKFLEYSKHNEEKYNRLPFDRYFVSKTKGKIADLENLNRSVYAGSTMGAAFLSNFCDNNEKYTHLDIAGVALNTYEPVGYMNVGNTGFGVDSLSSILQSIK